MKKIAYYQIFSFIIIFLLTICSCGGSGGGNGSGGGEQDSISPFEGTFTGEITTEGEEKTVETIRMSLKVSSPLSGIIYNKSNGDIGTISGEADGNLATFSGSIEGDCAASCDGTIKLIENDLISIEMEGIDCNGMLFSSFGELSRKQCINLAGTWCVTEEVKATYSYGEDVEYINQKGTTSIVLEQGADSCSVNYSVSGYGEEFARNGLISGNHIKFWGKFFAILEGDANILENRVTIEGNIIDPDEIKVSGVGIVRGTVEGKTFSCIGSADSTFRRQPDLAVAIIRGGSSSTPFDSSIPANNVLENIRDDAVKNRRITAKIFRSGASTFSVEEWLNKKNVAREECGNYDPIPAVLIGHSLGGDTVLRVVYSNVCSRIVLDHFDRDHILTFNQRNLVPRIAPPDGKVYSYLAENQFIWLGRRVAGANVIEEEIPNTDHGSIVEAVAATNVFQEKINECLENN